MPCALKEIVIVEVSQYVEYCPSITICRALCDLVPFLQSKKLKTPMEECYFLVKFQAKSEWYQTAQRITYFLMKCILFTIMPVAAGYCSLVTYH